MAQAAWRKALHLRPVCFDMSFRKLPFKGGFVLWAGLEDLVSALQEFRFGEVERAFLLESGFDPQFVAFLGEWEFRGSIWSVPEGEVVFPTEPLVRVEGTWIEACVIETILLNVLNFQSLIATKAARIRRVAGERHVSEFGLRRAPGDGGLAASRAAFIGGCDSTSNLEAARRYGITSVGTMSHAWVQYHGDELTAFRSFADAWPANSVLLLDTYSTLESGLPNALIVARELRERGGALFGVRLDSGDLAYMAQETRRGLDAAGFPEVKIVASNKLDEYVIRSLNEQQAPVDIFGVGTRLVTGDPEGALGGIYKLSEAEGQPRMKRSDTVSKSSLPGRKTVTRFYDQHGRPVADAVHLADEPPPTRMVHPFEPQSSFDLSRFRGEPLLQPAIVDGRHLAIPTVAAAVERAKQSLERLPAEHRRFENPHVYKVGLSPALAELRDRLLARASGH